VQLRHLLRAALACGLIVPVVSRAADEYWSYSYRNIDVTAEGTSAYAINLARYCVRLDGLLRRILGIQNTQPPPTHIFALSRGQMGQLLGENTSRYQVSGGDNFILTTNATAHDSDYWGAYFGYTAALLASDGWLSGPEWYRVGLPLVFAGTTYKGTRAQLGVIEFGYALTLGRGGSLIPMRVFLAHKRQEVLDEHRYNPEMYSAQAWALAHEIYVESWHRAEFTRYLELMRQGTSEADAFSACFKGSYEQLDKEFAVAIQKRQYVYTIEVPDDAAPKGETAQPLSAAQVKARVAQLAERFPSSP
jgi:hypothetical protein